MSLKPIKKAVRVAKDRLFPGRKRRREQLHNIGKQIEQIYFQLGEDRQYTEVHFQDITDLRNESQTQKHCLEKLNLRMNAIDSQSQTYWTAVEARVAELAESADRTNERVQLLFQLQSRIETLEQRLNGFVQQLNQQTTVLVGINTAIEQQQSSQSTQQTILQELSEQVQETRRGLEAQSSSLTSLHADLRQQQSASESISVQIGEHCSRLLADEFANTETGKQILRFLASLSGLDQRIAYLESQIEAFRRLPSEPGHPGVRHYNKTAAEVIEACKSIHRTPRPASKFCVKSYEFYSRNTAQLQPPFIYLDVKSIPRSGLHYLQRSLEAALEGRFSFCEWYQEPGCCRRMPCALTGYAKKCMEQRTPYLRMIKSHDFELDDPIFPPSQTLRRVVILRDPLYALTSYWTLQILDANQRVLNQYGINATKINYRHEQPVLDMAYRLIDQEGAIPETEKLFQWLTRLKRYMLGFVSKWGRHTPSDSVVRYQDVNQFIDQLIEEVKLQLSADIQGRIENWNQHRPVFKSREAPFDSPSKRITEHLQLHASMFRQFADEIVTEDETGLFASCRTDFSSAPELEVETALPAVVQQSAA